MVEAVGALTQVCRETGFYLERICKWADRLGCDQIRATIPDLRARRRVCIERFIHAQTLAQVDPRAECVAGKDTHELAPLATPGLEAAE